MILIVRDEKVIFTKIQFQTEIFVQITQHALEKITKERSKKHFGEDQRSKV